MRTRFAAPEDAISDASLAAVQARFRSPRLVLDEQPSGWRARYEPVDGAARVVLLRVATPEQAMEACEKACGRDLRWEEQGAALLVRDWRDA